jgi:ribulose-5-phosphate 4-epimerase/fuculose-1-phosphate aldolase
MHKKVIFTHHAQLKLKILRQHGIYFTETQIENAVNNPDTVLEAEKSRKIAQKILDAKHVIRVIFEIKNATIFIVTFYPARRSRYENKL